MDIGTITLVMVAAIVVLMAAGLPLIFVTGGVAMVTAIVLFGADSLMLIGSRTYSLVTEFVLVAVPMFVLMASILERSGVAKDLFRAMHLLAGRLPGGLAIQTMAVAVLMAAMTGIIGGEIVLLGLIALPQMLERGYQPQLAIGTICAGGSLGTMVPPSIVLVVYGLAANVSIGDLFIATLMPALLLALLYVFYVYTRCVLNPALAPMAKEADQALSPREKVSMLLGLVLPLAVAVWVLGSIYAGIASVSEAAGMGVVGAILSAAVRRELDWSLLRDAMYRTMTTCGMLIWLTFGANALIGVYNLSGGTQFVHDLITGLPFSPLAIIFLMMLVLIVLGMFMDWIGILLLTVPIFVPIVVSLGFDPVWFGVLFCLNMQISYLTPPFGPAAFYLKGVAPPEISLGMIFSSLWPFVGLQLVALVTLVLVPDLALWLPEALR